LNPVRDDFEKKNATLMKEMPELYHARLAYMQPSLEAFISTQVNEHFCLTVRSCATARRISILAELITYP